jgi:hypothetical protein
MGNDRRTPSRSRRLFRCSSFFGHAALSISLFFDYHAFQELAVLFLEVGKGLPIINAMQCNCTDSQELSPPTGNDPI